LIFRDAPRNHRWIRTFSPLLCIHPVSEPKIVGNEWTTEFEFEFNVILAALIRLLEFREVVAVVRQKFSSTPSLLWMGKGVVAAVCVRLV